MRGDVVSRYVVWPAVFGSESWGVRILASKGSNASSSSPISLASVDGRNKNSHIDPVSQAIASFFILYSVVSDPAACSCNIGLWANAKADESAIPVTQLMLCFYNRWEISGRLPRAYIFS